MFRRHSRSLTLALAVLVAPTAVSAQDIAFWSFDDLAVGEVTPFSQTKNGVTASFSSTTGPANGFSVLPTFLQTLTGNVLVSVNNQGNDLGIAFSSAVDSLDLTFAMNTQNVSTAFTVQTFLGLNAVGTINAFGFLGNTGFVEGLFVAVNTVFDRVVISSGAPDLAIDRLNVRTATVVPEPGSVMLMAFGLGALAAFARRRRIDSAA